MKTSKLKFVFGGILAAFITIELFAFTHSPAQEKILTFKLTTSQTQYIINTLEERPYKESAGIINSLVSQASEQLTVKTDSTGMKKDTVLKVKPKVKK